jgi:PilZ domain-containing protein
MPVLAPLRVPVELRLGTQRWFRYAHAVSEGGLAFARPLPDELDGVAEVSFHLPEDPAPIACRANPVADEGARRGDERDGAPARRALRFADLDEESRARIARYAEERVPA